MFVKAKEFRNYFAEFLQENGDFEEFSAPRPKVFTTFLAKHGQTQGQWDYT